MTPGVGSGGSGCFRISIKAASMSASVIIVQEHTIISTSEVIANGRELDLTAPRILV